MLPLGYLPLWGREGVTLRAAAEKKRITGKKDFNWARFSECLNFSPAMVYVFR